MAFEPLHSFFSQQPRVWDEVDVRHFIQQYLRSELKTEALYCDSVSRGIVTVRVASPALEQEIRLREVDITELVQLEAAYTLTRVRVYTAT